MKKYFIISAVALLALAACTKVTTGDGADAQREVNFAVANYVQTKADGGKFDTETKFGTYAWFTNDNKEVTEWMVNEEVGLVGSVWKTTQNTYYWPKTGSADFISYSPFAGEVNKTPKAPEANQGTAATPAAGNDMAEKPAPEPVITRSEDAKYTFEYGKFAPYRVNGSAYDLMYADWYQGNANVDQIKDDDRQDSGYKGVPTLFHHALAQVSFLIRTNFTEYGSGDAKTTWEVTLRRAELKNLKHTGTLALTMDADHKWVLPENKIWTAAGDPENLLLFPEKEAANEKPGLSLTKEFQPLLEDYFVLPQELGTSDPGNKVFAQSLALEIDIKTTLSNGNTIKETYSKEFDLSDLIINYGKPVASDFTLEKAWRMNQRFVYKISIKPTALGPGDGPDDPTDVLITYDPAVTDWETYDTAVTINL